MAEAPARRRRWPRVALALLLTAWLGLRYGNTIAIALESSEPSVSIGTPERGSLRHGKRLPSRGENFRAYSDLGALLGRNSVHERVRAATLQAYGTLAVDHPQTKFVYGETGWPGGGRFRPHRTHQNGLAVDFFVPVVDRHGHSRHLPSHVFNRFGYDIEFDDDGRWREFSIDHAAMAAHLRALNAAARAQGLRIELVILETSLQKHLFRAPGGAGLDRAMRFSTRQAWVRHDEHYHVVFVQQD